MPKFLYKLVNLIRSYKRKHKGMYFSEHSVVLVCIHKSYIVCLEKYAVPIRHGFSFFFGGEKVVESHC